VPAARGRIISRLASDPLRCGRAALLRRQPLGPALGYQQLSLGATQRKAVADLTAREVDPVNAFGVFSREVHRFYILNVVYRRSTLTTDVTPFIDDVGTEIAPH
jgi:hypothetical protein